MLKNADEIERVADKIPIYPSSTMAARKRNSDVHPAAVGLEEFASKLAELIDQKLTIYEIELDKIYSKPETKKKNKREKLLPPSSAVWVASEKGDEKTAKKTKPKQKERVPLPKSPTTSAIHITIPPESNKSYFKMMKKARRKIHLDEIGIDEVRPRWAKTGGLLLELAGPDREENADKLTHMLDKTLSAGGVQVSRPMKRVELIVKDLQDFITPAEVQSSISSQGECDIEDVDCGKFRLKPNGLSGTMWVRCPLTAARKILDARRLKVDWFSLRVEVFKPRPLQCYRCLAYGHVRQQCTDSIDRSKRCYRCGKKNHTVAQCSATIPKCPVCSDIGLPAKHRLGSGGCSIHTNKKVEMKKSEKPNTRMIQSQDKKGPWMKTLSLPRGGEFI